jgi:type III restriction enzyme
VFELKAFQEKAITDLLKQTRTLISTPGENKKCVFKSPTGSGKTIMMAEMLQRMSGEDFAADLVFVWVSLYDLHTQSKAKLARHLKDSRYQLLSLEDIDDQGLPDSTILFVNWHSLTTQKTNPDSNEKEWANVYVRDREDGQSIISVLEKTRLNGKQTVLIVDEAHRNYLTDNSQKFITEVIQPKLTIEVSATPLLKIDPEDLVNQRAGFVAVSFGDAVSSGLIKQETLINQNVGDYVNLADSADELVLNAAIARRGELANSYKTSNANVNPLVLVQLPSETEKTSALDITVREEVEGLLAKQGITYDNGKLAVWLSEEKRNLDLIEKNDSSVEVLIFKEAVAVGWDCPRAQVLVMLRAIRSITFEIQTVGRILRMPEARHYDAPLLNKAFIFTNISGININDRPEDLDFFKTKFAQKKSSTAGVEIPSQYLHRQDYGDLTAAFSNILVEELNKRFGITDSDSVNSAYEKADLGLELYPEELTMPILSDVVVQNIDSIQSELGDLDIKHIQANVSDANIQKEFDYLLKVWSLPYAPVRSFSKVKTGLYKWFGIIGLTTSKWNDVQRIVACSASNQTLFSEVIASAKERYELEKPAEQAGRKDITISSYSPPETMTAGEKHESVSLSRYGYKPAFLLANRSQPERKLEEVLESSDKVDWWIKNGEGQQQFFSIVYKYVDAQSGLNKQANFYPDFVVKFVDKSIGIYETKSGMTLTDYLTAAKSDALQLFISNNQNLGLVGGIVNATPEGLKLFRGEKYTPDQSTWETLKL